MEVMLAETRGEKYYCRVTRAMAQASGEIVIDAPEGTSTAPMVALAAATEEGDGAGAPRPPVAAPFDAETEDGAPAPLPASSPAAPLVLGVRMFLHGSQQHLAAYDLSRLSEVTDTGASGASGTLAQIVDCYRPSPFYVGGLDAVGAPARDAFASTRTRAYPSVAGGARERVRAAAARADAAARSPPASGRVARRSRSACWPRATPPRPSSTRSARSRSSTATPCASPTRPSTPGPREGDSASLRRGRAARVPEIASPRRERSEG